MSKPDWLGARADSAPRSPATISGATVTGEKRTVAPGETVRSLLSAACMAWIWARSSEGVGAGLSGDTARWATTRERSCRAPTRTSKFPGSGAVFAAAAAPAKTGIARRITPPTAGRRTFHLMQTSSSGRELELELRAEAELYLPRDPDGLPAKGERMNLQA